MSINIIPLPKHIEEDPFGGYALLKPVLCVPEQWERAAAAFCGYASGIGIHFEIRVNDSADSCGSCVNCPVGSSEQIIIAYEKGSVRYSGGYELCINSGGGYICAADETGFSRGLATLFQLIRAGGSAEKSGLALPVVKIEDGPDCSYRGMMVDLARYWHPFEFLLSYIDLCWYYKLSSLHLHFTDDQSYTLPGKKYPKLSTSGRSYSFEEISRLNRYALDRGIEIIPEVEVPGHNSGFSAGYPELFGTNGIICMHEDSVSAIADIFREVCELFPYSRHIHLGGDEANLKRWLDCPECMEYARSIGIDTNAPGEEICDRLYVDFIVRTAGVIKEKGKIPIVWEGFPKHMNHLVPKDIVVMSWENYYQITPDLLEAGFEIINCSWNPMYIVAPDVKWTPEEVNAWSIFKWRPVHPGSPFIGREYESEPTDKVLGGQLLAWGDRVISAYAGNENQGAFVEMKLLSERLPYLAQNTWNRDGREEFSSISRVVDNVRPRIESVLLSRVGELTGGTDRK